MKGRIPTRALFGPGDVRLAHQTDEFVPIDDLLIAARDPGAAGPAILRGSASDSARKEDDHAYSGYSWAASLPAGAHGMHPEPPPISRHVGTSSGTPLISRCHRSSMEPARQAV